MADSNAEVRSARGEWQPAVPIELAPVFVWPPRPLAALKWLFGYPGYLLPWNVIYIGIAAVTWLFLTPELARMARFEPGWIAALYGRNLLMLAAITGAWHLRLYIVRAQGERFKYNKRWLSTNNKTFLFGHQTRDNMFWTLVSGGGFWTAYEVVTMWAFANGWLPFVELRTNPVYFVLLLLAVPVMRDFHFYWVHRLIHWKPLYKAAHYLHHKNVNVGPWSGLAMHPIEHLLYFTGVLLHWVIPSHPVHAILHLQHAGFTPAQGHSGFDELVIDGDATIKNANFFHYLHHRYFECNYGGDGTVPVDRWFGSFHDGTPEAHARMRARAHTRLRARRAGAPAA